MYLLILMLCIVMMLFTYLLSEIDTSKYNKKELQKKVKSIHNNIFNRGKEKENENKNRR